MSSKRHLGWEGERVKMVGMRRTNQGEYVKEGHCNYQRDWQQQSTEQRQQQTTQQQQQQQQPQTTKQQQQQQQTTQKQQQQQTKFLMLDTTCCLQIGSKRMLDLALVLHRFFLRWFFFYMPLPMANSKKYPSWFGVLRGCQPSSNSSSSRSSRHQKTPSRSSSNR